LVDDPSRLVDSSTSSVEGERMRRDLPVGTVTFVFTDIEGSTRMLEELGADAYGVLLARHHEVQVGVGRATRPGLD
jgi:class 3 adenylate cyclase